MNLRELCEKTAVYTDRRDDFVTIPDPANPDKQIYDPDDDPGIWFDAMKTSINTAYREAARRLLSPDIQIELELAENGEIDLIYLSPGVQTVKAVYTADGSAALPYDFVTKYRLRVRNGREGDKVLLQYHYVPEPLEQLTDEPEFPESLVDPMVYISLAASDIWMLERKLEPAQAWQTKYYSLLSSLKRDMKNASKRRIRRAVFR